MRFFLFLILFLPQISLAQLFTKESVAYDANGGKGSTDGYRLRWGYFLGMNTYDFNFDYKEDYRDIYVKQHFGFNAGLFGNLRINDYIDLRLEPALVINSRDLHYSASHFPDANIVDDDQVYKYYLIRKVNSTYIHLPLLVKFSTKRINNIKPFVVAGVSTSFNLSSNESSQDDNRNEVFRLKKNTMNIELGLGIDLYFFFFKFSPSIRGVFSLNDELIPDKDPKSPWTSNIENMKSRGIFLNFTFQ